MDQVFDLFGDPVPDNAGRRGRPQHLPTRENRNKVNMLLAFGWNDDRIARALHITPPTLRKHYFSELRFRDETRDRLDATLAMHLWRQVEAGNVSAIREFRELLARNDLMLFNGHPADTKSEKQTKLGKKEQAALDARQPDASTEMGRLMAGQTIN